MKTKLRKWQADLICLLLTDPEEAPIYIIVDSKGGTGKTFMTNWLVCRNYATRITRLDQLNPPKPRERRNSLPLRSSLISSDNPRTTTYTGNYIFDGEIDISAIGDIKNAGGNSRKTSFSREETSLSRPHVIVFTNNFLPEMKGWRHYIIDENKGLVSFE